MANNLRRRVAVTGLGVVAPNGIGTEAFWQATNHGISAITRLHYANDTSLDSSSWAVGKVNNFVVEDYTGRKLAHRSDRMTHFALAAIQEALYSSSLHIEQENPLRVGAVIANTMGGMEFVLKQLQTLYTRGPRFVSAYTAIAWLNVASVGQAAIRYGIQGYCKTPVNDAASGLNALGMAYSAIRRGAADVIITGGCEAFLHPMFLQVMEQQGICIPGDDPAAYRPFDMRAHGLILAEGAGICILEEYEHALRRDAPIYGEIVGFGQTQDIHGLAAPSSDGTQYARAISLAMQEANLTPPDIRFILADGRAIPSSDQGEAYAFHQALGAHLAQIPLTVPRTMIGHSYAAAGAIDTITALLALQHDTIPPTINCEEFDPCYNLDLVRDAPRPIPPSNSSSRGILIGGRSIGGANIALVLQKLI
jgi:3-oxoacyl-(acyl-carrier-protein) synthase